MPPRLRARKRAATDGVLDLPQAFVCLTRWVGQGSGAFVTNILGRFFKRFIQSFPDPVMELESSG